jgi:hypothetical protein
VASMTVEVDQSHTCGPVISWLCYLGQVPFNSVTRLFDFLIYKHSPCGGITEEVEKAGRGSGKSLTPKKKKERLEGREGGRKDAPPGL